MNGTPRFRVAILMAVALVLSVNSFAQFYRGSNVVFGKNRVQYRKYDWFYVPGKHFHVYYYQGNQKFAEKVYLIAEQELSRLTQLYSFPFNDKIQLLTFSKQSEFRQSNLGMSDDEATSLGGTTTILGSKMFVYYQDSDEDIRKQVALGISRIFFMELIYGSNWRDIVRGNSRMALPEWFTEGAILYAALGDSRVATKIAEDWLVTSKNQMLHRLNGEIAANVGQAFWSYIVESYGENVMFSILNMTQLFRNTDSGFSYVIGRNTERVIAEFIANLRQKDIDEAQETTSQAELTRRKVRLSETQKRWQTKYVYKNLTPSPTNNYWAYARFLNGEYSVFITEITTGKSQRICKGDIKSDRIPDYTTPLFAWHPNGELVSFMIEKQGKMYWCSYRLDTKELNERQLNGLDKVLSYQYSADGKRIVLSGSNNGYSNLFVMPITGNTPKKITDDIYDDLNPIFSENGRKIYFSSNRGLAMDPLHDSINKVASYYHVYELSLNEDGSFDRMAQLTNADANDLFLARGVENKIQFIRKKLAIDERCSVFRDSTIASIDTTIHYRYFNVTEILERSTRPTTAYYTDATQKNGYWIRNVSVFPSSKKISLESDLALSVEGEDIKRPEANAPYTEMRWIPKKKDLFRIDTENFLFPKDKLQQNQKNNPSQSAPVDSQIVAIPKSNLYLLNFTTDYVQSQWDNQFASNFYQNFTGPSSISPGFSFYSKVGITDLLDDYKLSAGVRLSANLKNSDFMLSFTNLKYRWDKRASIQRQTQELGANGIFYQAQTFVASFEWVYPFTETSALHLTALGRNDRIVVLGVDNYTLGYKNQYENNLGGKVEYTFDNTYQKGINYRLGTRFKSWFEAYKQPDKLQQKNSIYVAGFDFRHYQRIHRDLTFAFRMAGASSFGDYKVVHYLGGVDNWLGQKIDNSVNVSTTNGYTFQAFAGPLRGFYVNARNGNNFIVSNAEIRLPIVRYLSAVPPKSDFADNLSLIGFFDVGSAWSGKSPYDARNDFNIYTVTQKPVSVSIQSNREPIIYGYGFGVRSKVLGYFMRLDWAWGVDDHQVLPRVFYWSMNLDF